MRTKKLLTSVENIARSLAQRYDLDYDLVLAAVRQVLQKFKTLNEMTIIEKLTWQKKAGIISETQYREAVEALSSEDAIRNMVKETLTGLLNEKKKKSKKPKPQEEPIDDTAMPEEGGELDITAPEGGEGMDDMGMETPPMGAEGGEDELMQKTLEFQREIEPATDDDKYKQIVQNLVSYLARKMNVEK